MKSKVEVEGTDELVTISSCLKDFKWLISAMGSKDDPRQELSAIHVRKGYAFATDKKRIHVLHFNLDLSIPEIPEGTWEVEKDNKRWIMLKRNEEKTWNDKVNIGRVFPDVSGYKRMRFEDWGIAEHEGCFYTAFVRKYPYYVDYRYFMDLIKDVNSGMGSSFYSDIVVFHSVDDAYAPIIAYGEGQCGMRLGVLMPVKV